MLASLEGPPRVRKFGGRMRQPARRVECKGRGDVVVIVLEAEEVGEQLGDGRKG
jgi:hypothetical protein